MRRTISAVLAAVFRDHRGELRIVLVRRGTRGIHGGQLGLPGGRYEPGDNSLLQTALREAEEETGLARADAELLTPLAALDTQTTGFRVYPYLARITPPQYWRVAPGEIAAVITPTVRLLANPATRERRELWFATWPASRQVDCVVLEGGELLWGLTLRVLEPLLPRLLGGEWAI